VLVLYPPPDFETYVHARRLYVGGSFAIVDNRRVNYIFTTAGSAPESMGVGLDGMVAAMAVYSGTQEQIAVAGTFTRAYLSEGSVRSGGLVMWHQKDRSWRLVGDAAINGFAFAVAVRGQELWVGGKFSAVGTQSAANVAMYNGNAWHVLKTGVEGEVYAITVTARNDTYVGGLIHSAGGVAVQNVARWDGVNWVSLVDEVCSKTGSTLCGVDGVVNALATVGEYVYAAGSFLRAGGKPAENVAVYFSGEWSSLGGGVQGGSVYAMNVVSLGVGACIYYAGDFKYVRDERGTMPAHGLAKWCVGNPGRSRLQYESLDTLWTPVAVPEGVVQIRAIGSFQK
jgi:hypothetical protein